MSRNQEPFLLSTDIFARTRFKFTHNKNRMLRLCQICFEEKPETDFSDAVNNSDGIHKWCKPCLREYARLGWLKRRTKVTRIRIPRSEYKNPVGGYRPRKIQSLKKTESTLPENLNASHYVSFD